MAITYSLAPIPKWYIADLTGKPLGGGSMYTYRSLDKTQFKFVFQDPAGNFPWPDPILFDENGSQGPFYWEVDSNNPDESYYIEVYDADGVLQWTIDNFDPVGNGGGSVITTALDLENLIVNNVFWRNIGSTASPIASVTTKVAPGAHAGLALTTSNAGPDIYFIKNNLNALDQITFPKFALGSTPLTGDVTPVDYFKYVCTNSPSGETEKFIQFPITRSIQNLTNQDVKVTIWARGNSPSTGNTLLLQWFQFTGDGAGAAPSALTPIQSITLTTGWVKTVISDTIPDVSALSPLGACGNDALFLQIHFPLGSVCDIDLTKPGVYLGNVSPTEDYHTYDMIDAVINSRRTGYVEQGFDASALPGYVIMNDGTIGSAISGGTTRANIDTFPLYNLLYTNVIDAYAPVSGGRTGSAINDFVANKTLQLTQTLGRALCAAGTGAGLMLHDLGQFFGTEFNTNVPAHTHTGTVNIVGTQGASSGGQSFLQGGATSPATLGWNFTTNSTGTAPPGVNNIQPSTFLNFFIKL